MPVDVLNRQRKVSISRKRIEEIALAILRALGQEDAEWIVTLVSDRKMTELNRQFRGKQGTTDVLSFPFDAAMAPPGMQPILGDVVISVERATLQAKERSLELRASEYDLESELTFLLIHGALHLLGYDHVQPRDAQKMEKLEAEIFRSFSPHPPRDHHKE